MASLQPASKLPVSSEPPEPAQPGGSPVQILILFSKFLGERRKQVSE